MTRGQDFPVDGVRRWNHILTQTEHTLTEIKHIVLNHDLPTFCHGEAQPTDPEHRAAPPKCQHHPMDYDNEDLSPAPKSCYSPPPVHTNDSNDDGSDRTPSPKPKHWRPLLDYNNHDDGEDLVPAPKRRQRPHRILGSDEEQPHLDYTSMQMSRERPPEEEQRPASVNGRRIWLPIQSQNYDALLNRRADIPEQAHGPQPAFWTIPPQPQRPASPLLDLTDEDTLIPAAKLKMTPAPRRFRKGVRGLLLPPKPRMAFFESNGY
ncbi:hypothetical protein M405DRAFT_885915 [Rhizopogon salebrosus TDB-379]|nr:hypothetical protein M405DRAFT_885915 [Rhizopogon salebrosus TDB-379]